MTTKLSMLWPRVARGGIRPQLEEKQPRHCREEELRTGLMGMTLLAIAAVQPVYGQTVDDLMKLGTSTRTMLPGDPAGSPSLRPSPKQ